MTFRQFLVWRAWLDLQWNRPDRHDYYAMAVRMDVLRGNVKRPKKIKLEDMKIPFRVEGEKPAASMSVEQATALAQARWRLRLGAAAKQAEVRQDEGGEVRTWGPSGERIK